MLETLIEQGWGDYLLFALAVFCLYLVWRFTPFGRSDGDEGGFWSWFFDGDDDDGD